MREILFRGKRTDNGEWVYGAFSEYDVKLDERGEIIIYRDPCIIDYSDELLWNGVDPDTVGQYIGGTDKNGKKIFEGDIVRVHDYLAKRGDPWHEFEGVVGHENASFVIISDVVKHYRWMDYECEIIGNIHDNPELLEDKP